MRSDVHHEISTSKLICLIIGFLSAVVVVVYSEPLREKRQTTTPEVYTIDTLVVADDALFEKWEQYIVEKTNLVPGPGSNLTQVVEKELKEYLSLVAHQANARLQNLRQHLPYYVRVQIVAFRINVNVLGSVERDLLTGDLVAEKPLTAFHDYIVKEGLGDLYDHAILFTGYQVSNLGTPSDEQVIGGRAYVGGMCQTNGNSATIVYEQGGFQSSSVIAHELGHSIGSPHDGELSNSDCDPKEHYLMSAYGGGEAAADTRFHSWYFSTCSANTINGFITDLISQNPSNSFAQNCLSKNSTPSAEFLSTSGTVAGQMFGPDVQCRMIYGANYQFCYPGSLDELSSICTVMGCQESPISGQQYTTCYYRYAAEGTSCGDRKWCRLGQCVESDLAPAMGDCPFGDRGNTICDSVATNPANCYSPSFRSACCQSCNAIKKDSQVCPYGDKSSDCVPNRCQETFPNGEDLAEICCGTCETDVNRPCVDVSTIDGVTCDVRVNLRLTQNCYNHTVAFHCCQTCSHLRKTVTDCEYGDRLLGSLCSDVAGEDKSQCSDATKKFSCCESCENDGSNSGTRLQLCLSFYLFCISSFLLFFARKQNFYICL